MPKSRTRLEKQTLDKDLDKFSLAEEASQQVMRGLAAPGLALLFLLLSMAFAASFVTNSATAPIIIAAAAIAGYMAMNIGANDVTNNVGAAVGAKAMSMVTALTIAAVFEIAGAMLAGRQVTLTVEAGIIYGEDILGAQTIVWVMMAALASSAVWINIATYSGAPVSTTHSIIGGIVGAGIAAAGVSSVQWWELAGITASWSISPVLGGVIAAAFLALLKEFIIYREDKIASARRWMPVLLGVTAGCFTAYLAVIALVQVASISLVTGLGLGLIVGIVVYFLSKPWIRRQSEGLDNRNQSLRKLFRAPLILAAALLSFAHGANDVSNAIGPLSAIVSALDGVITTERSPTPLWELAIGAIGISLGLLLYGPRLIRVVGQEITRLNPMRAFCVALATAVTVLLASALGLPISSTHTAVGAVFGVGFFREWYTRHSQRRLEYVRQKTGQADFMGSTETNFAEVRRRRLVRRSHFLTIVAAWVITVPASALLSAVVYFILSSLFI
ncbi:MULTISPECIES: inorganic phosphate transporter [Ensifer]|uniref:Phosphate transporter n=1 Tax=Ensifer canadensis TaxID=555315 RepID=A0AAW4FIT7_9HYPH|nr:MULTISPECIES: inorganic phosphate transporter [Ensifer]AHK43512.1 putative phosphate transport permease protein [Ensifer adhaerens OV14]MDP9628294.1 PiT family inorganic phosphate transporter [Ensifer adhaerens]KQU71716.1 inorganic phosphate transporter [Ensifer sp. Root31]KQW62656.1 inorganic phosphate transporter [Ensifer sp. Root1252]KQW84772.1 inorganic phosphate transporter [Ensifer sp. Root127]